MFDNPKQNPTVLQQLSQVLTDLQRLQPQIEAALEYTHGTHTFDDICAMVLTGRIRFWALPNSFMLTEVLEYPRAKHYHMFLVGGDLQEIKAQLAPVTAAAHEAGCVALTGAGRIGWGKALADQGWKHAYTTYFLPIVEEEPHGRRR